MHPLDRPIWTALETRHARFSNAADRARRYPADVSPFVAGLDDSPEAAAAIVSLIGPEEEISLVAIDPPSAPAGVRETRMPLLQMVWDTFPALARHPDRGAFAIRPLGEEDAPDMLALAQLTRPGPFRLRTHTMGRFLGVRVDGKLIAMAGERLHVPGFHEISAVCTHPDWQGRGLGAALITAVGARMLDDGDTPFLHTYGNNASAVGLYTKLGFIVRANLIHALWMRDKHP